MSDSFSVILKSVAAGERLDVEGAARAFSMIMAVEVSDIHIAAFPDDVAVRTPSFDGFVGPPLAMPRSLQRLLATTSPLDLWRPGLHRPGPPHHTPPRPFGVDL